MLAACTYGRKQHRPKSRSFPKLDGKQICFLHHEPQANGLVGQRRYVAAMLPVDRLLDLVADQEVTVVECKTGDRLARFVLNFHSYTPTRTGRIIDLQCFAGKAKWPRQ